MLKNNSNVKYSNILTIDNPIIEEKLKHATRLYHLHKYEEATGKCKEAIDLCDKNSLEQAICYYRLAITNRGKRNAEVNYSYLSEALLIFKDYSDQNDDLIIQIQKSLAHQTKFALDMKAGDKLLLATETLLKYIKTRPNTEYEVECYRNLYHIALAQGDIDTAKDYINKAKTICIDNSIEIKHDIKMKFIDAINDSKSDKKEVTRKKIIKEIFTPYYDQYVDDFLKERKPHLKILIQKDLLFMLVVKLFIEAPSTAIKCIMNLAKKIFYGNDLSEIRESLNLKVSQFNENHKILLGLNLFPDKNPPFFTKENVLYNDTSLLSSINIFEEKNPSVSQNQLTTTTESYSLKPEWKR